MCSFNSNKQIKEKTRKPKKWTTFSLSSNVRMRGTLGPLWLSPFGYLGPQIAVLILVNRLDMKTALSTASIQACRHTNNPMFAAGSSSLRLLLNGVLRCSSALSRIFAPYSKQTPREGKKNARSIGPDELACHSPCCRRPIACSPTFLPSSEWAFADSQLHVRSAFVSELVIVVSFPCAHLAHDGSLAVVLVSW